MNPSKNSLAYDLQEPFRFLVDLVVISLIESDKVENKDFRMADSDEIRPKILSISYSEWKKMKFSNVILYYMKKNAMSDKPFSLNEHVRERLEM
ncbi:CRISPR-associated endonuclease Cas1 [Methanolobus sp.]|uniref:CRISPR-associated endonuclease Cas1 n=1 Tax=Methanolobus sp. TaxID=1874737 RepID=UPI00345B3928